MLWSDPAQRPRIVEIRDNLTARITEAEREGWLGEIEGLKISLVGASDKLALRDEELPGREAPCFTARFWEGNASGSLPAGAVRRCLWDHMQFVDLRRCPRARGDAPQHARFGA